MADKNVLQFTELAAAPAATDMLYIGDVSEPVADDQNKKINPDNLMKFLGTGNYTGSIVIATGQTITVASDTDAVSILGRAKVGYDGATADVAVFAHFDQMSATNFALSHDANGATIVNAATGQGISFSINDAAIFGINASGLIGAAGARLTQFDDDLVANSATRGVTQAAVVAGIATPTISDFSSAQHDHSNAAGGGSTLSSPTIVTPTIASFANAGHDHSNAAGGGNLGNVTTGSITSAANVISMAANTDTEHIFGRAKVGYDGTNSDHAVFAHYDYMTGTNFALKQNQNGATILNAVTGQTVQFRVNNVNVGSIGAGNLTLVGIPILAAADVDVEHHLGKAKIGYDGTNADMVVFAHFDHFSNGNYAIRQASGGTTKVNAPSTSFGLIFAIDDSNMFDLTADGLRGGVANARITTFLDEDTMASDSATAGVTQQSVKAYVDSYRTRVVHLEAFIAATAVATGNGKVGIVITPDMNGLELNGVIAGVHDKGVTGTTDVMIRRRRGGVDADMLSTPITIGDEWYAADGVINATNDDIATGDAILVDVDAVHSGTAPNGLWVTLTFGPA